MTSSLRQALILLLAATLLAFGLALKSPSLPPPVDAKALTILPSQVPRFDQPLWVDARASDDFQKGHLVGAVPLSPDSWDSQLPQVVAAWSPQKAILVYCNPGTCETSREVAQRLRHELGVETIYALDGDWREIRQP